MFDKYNPILLSVLSLAISSCSNSNSEAEIKTIVSNQQIAARFKLVNAKFTQEQLCLDWKTVIGLIASVQPSRDPYGSLLSQDEQIDIIDKCPDSYIDLAQRTRNLIRKEKDFHTEIVPGFSLSTRSGPVVVSCSGGIECADIMGAQVLPLSSDTTYVYAMIQGKTFNVPLRLEEVNNRRISLIKEAAISDLAPVPRANTQDFASHLLEHKAIEGGSFQDLMLSTRALLTGNTLRIAASYQPSQGVYSNRKDYQLENLVYSKEAFHCANIFYDKDDSFACLTDDNIPVVRISSWNGNASDILRSLDGNTSPDSRIIIDVRGNTGGSTLDATDFLCSMGVEAIYDRMDKTTLISSVIEQRNLSLSPGRTIDILSLAKSGNVGILKTGESLEPKNFPIVRKTYVTSWLQRHDVTMETCRGKGIKAMFGRKWIVLTNGGEFSATENFLALAKDDENIKIIGRRSMGGTGNPVMFELPETKMKVILSTSRMKIAKENVIEGEGVLPNVRLNDYELDVPFLFENRIRWFMNHELEDMPLVPAIERAIREAKSI